MPMTYIVICIFILIFTNRIEDGVGDETYAGAIALAVMVLVACIVLGQILCGLYLSCFRWCKHKKPLMFNEGCQVSPMDLGTVQDNCTQIEPRIMWNINYGYRFRKNQGQQ